MEQKTPLLGLNPEELKDVAAQVGLRPFAARQMAAWLYKRGATDIEQMTDLPKKARELLAQKYVVGREEPVFSATSTDGTVKYIFRGVPGRNIEAVYIPEADRATLCVSSQAGCRMNCRFCMTGRGGFQGNLSAAQILNQVLSIPQSQNLTNIVFMGMGEPADNADEVVRAINAITSDWGMGWSPRRITVSSIGKLDGLRKFLDSTQVHIAISAHNPYPADRADIMPVERAFPLIKVMEELRKYDFAHQRRLSLEYTMFKGMNDSHRHAEALARILRGTPARVNLIRFHRVPGFEGEPSDRKTMEDFRDTLNALGVTATIRASRGEDIMAACGMLAGKSDNSDNSVNNG